MEKNELIDSFVEWANKPENKKKAYNNLIKKERLLDWDHRYFGDQLFTIDDNDLPESIERIRALVYENKQQAWIDYNKKTLNHAPRAILGKDNYLKFLSEKILAETHVPDVQEEKESDSGKSENAKINNDNPARGKLKKNYFVFGTNEASLEQLTMDGTLVDFWFTGNYWYKNDTKIGDIAFFVQKGEESKLKWPRGMAAICEIVGIRDDPKGKKTKKGALYFDVKLKPLLKLPKVLDKPEFQKYPEVKDIRHIATLEKRDPNQTSWKIPEELAKYLVGVLIDIFPTLSGNIISIFGSSFPIMPAKNDNQIIEEDENLKKLTTNEIINKPRNLIIYGAPGTGKSYMLKILTEGIGISSKGLFPDDQLRVRITFHPNYTYRNFVGAFKPSPIYKDSEERFLGQDMRTLIADQKEPIIDYKFEPGPFIEMYVKAVKFPNLNFVIIIEELNRANTASVFGDIFQLLDRNEDGESEFPILLEPAAYYYLKGKGITQNQIKIPKNLYLWATMNNADQGVMPLDSAFKRRWTFEHLDLNSNQSVVEDCTITLPVENQIKKINWNKFREVINNELIKDGIHEDKLIGPFFLTRSEMNDSGTVKNKLLLYLKEDVLRYKSGVFKNELRTFSLISQAFAAGKSIFLESIESQLYNIENNPGEINEIADQSSEELQVNE